jgi:hypothetical protein
VSRIIKLILTISLKGKMLNDDKVWYINISW